MKIYIVFDGRCDECHSGEILGVFTSEDSADSQARIYAEEYVKDHPDCRMVTARSGVALINSQGGYLFTVPVEEKDVVEI